MREIRVAVVGNPNTGKSSLINAIAGAKLQVGNWSGTTVEKKEVLFTHRGFNIHFIDLPGAYSLTPFSLDEKITRDYLFLEDYDVILCVVDTTNFERNLYFVVQLLELEKPIVLALNMFDEARRLGYKVDVEFLESLLKVRAVPTVAIKSVGVEELKEAIVDVHEKRLLPQKLTYGEDLARLVSEVRDSLSARNPELLQMSLGVILKVIEGDQELIEKVGLRYSKEEVDRLGEHIRNVHGLELSDYLLELRYGLAAGIARSVLQKPEVRRETLTEKLDRVVLNRVLGLPVFVLVMWLAFKVAFDISSPYVDFLDEAISGIFAKWAGVLLEGADSPDWLSSLLVDGVIGGVGIILSFVPVIGMIMLVVTFLETSGYMPRVAFLMDRIMRSFGLQGKAFIPLLLGFGCNVPAVYACRVFEQDYERRLTMFLIPFMSCGARLPVYAVLVAVFFSQRKAEVLLFLYLLGIAVALALAIILHKFLFKGVSAPFIMEIPPYRFPTIRNLWVHTWLKLRHFLIKAGTWILLVNVVVWMSLNLPWKPENVEGSLLGRVGRVIAPALSPLGFGDWQASASLLAGVLAKEVVVSTMSQIYAAQAKEEEQEAVSLSEDLRGLVLSFVEKTREAAANLFSTFGIASLRLEDEEGEEIKDKLKERFSQASALAFLVFVLLYWPCAVYGIATRLETGSFKLYLQAIVLHTVVAWAVSFATFNLTKFFLS